MRGIRELELEGFLTVTREDGRRSVYRFTLTDQCQTVTGDSVAPVTDSHPTSDSQSLVPVTHSHHPPVTHSHPKKIRSKQTIEAGKEAGAHTPEKRPELGGSRPLLRHQFAKDWRPKQTHRTRGIEIGLTDEEILARAEDCLVKPITHGFFEEDDHFFRELEWARAAKETRAFKAQREDFEMPGRKRRSP